MTAKDAALFGRLVGAYASKRLLIGVRTGDLNRPGSPVWSAGESVVPLLALVIISGAFLFALGLIACIAMLVLSFIVYAFVIRPYTVKSVFRRTIAAAIENLHNWDLLWSKGGLVIGLT